MCIPCLLDDESEHCDECQEHCEECIGGIGCFHDQVGLATIVFDEHIQMFHNTTINLHSSLFDNYHVVPNYSGKMDKKK